MVREIILKTHHMKTIEFTVTMVNKYKIFTIEINGRPAYLPYFFPSVWIATHPDSDDHPKIQIWVYHKDILVCAGIVVERNNFSSWENVHLFFGDADQAYVDRPIQRSFFKTMREDDVTDGPLKRLYAHNLQEGDILEIRLSNEEGKAMEERLKTNPIIFDGGSFIVLNPERIM